MVTLVTEPEDYSPKAIAAYKKLGPVYFLPKLNKSQKVKVMREANVLVVRLANRIDKSWVDSMPNLKVVATNTTGLNHIDMDYAARSGVKVFSLRGRKSFLRNITATAELTMGLMMGLVRNIPWAHNDVVLAGKWDRNTFRGRQVKGKTFGILGYGRLGRIVGRYAKTFGMSVIAHDPNVSGVVMARGGVKSVGMNELFKKADILSVHVLLTNKTHNLVTQKHFKLMKPTSYFINTAREEILEKGALWAALKNNIIAGAAVDVMRDEKADGGHLKKDVLHKYAQKNSNLLIVPHIGGAAYEAMQITEDFIADLVTRYVRRAKLV